MAAAEDYSQPQGQEQVPPQGQEQTQGQDTARDKWARAMGIGNIASELSETRLAKIGQDVVSEYRIDKESRADWEKKIKDAENLANQVMETKNDPWPGASNVKYPTLTQAAIQFNARAYANIIRGQNVVKCRVVGQDKESEKASRAERVSQHMSYQLTEQMEEWETDMDRALLLLPILGCVFKKTYYDPTLRRNVSIFRKPQDVVVHYWATSIETTPRITDRFVLYPHQIEERIRSKAAWIDIRSSLGSTVSALEEGQAEHSPQDPDAPHLFLEQHRYLDLDDDGVREPYIVTVHFATQKVVRIVPRFLMDGIRFGDDAEVESIQAFQHFTKFDFIPSPDGGFYGWGFGLMMGPLNRVINTTINQLIDAGTAANMQSGFMGRGVSMGVNHEGGVIELEMGKFTPVDFPGDDIRKAIMPAPFKEPSLVLFQLLGTIISAAEKMSAVTDVLSGEQPSANVPAATVLALIEQGLKVFSSIYKRIYLSLKKEFKKLYILNGIYLEDEAYYLVLDTTKAIAKKDYNFQDCDIQPVSSDADVADIQRIVKAQALMELRGQGYNDRAITDRYLDALNIPNVDEIKNAPPQPQGPDPKLLIEQAKLEFQTKELQLEGARLELERQKTVQQGLLAMSQAIKNMAQAEAAEAGPQLEYYKSQVKAITDMVKAQVSMKAKESGNGGARRESGAAGMEAQPSGEGGLALPQPGEAAPPGGTGPGENPVLGAGGPIGPENGMGGGPGGPAEANLGV